MSVSWEKRAWGEVLAEHAAQRPHAEAFVCAGVRLDWAELHGRARRAAAGLQALGIGRGDHVAVCMGNSAEWLTLFYANALLGAVTVPVNTRFKADELRYCLAQSNAKLLALAGRFLKIDFLAMLRTICPAVDAGLPDPALPRLRRVVVLGDDVPAGALPWSLLEEDRAPRLSPVDPDATALIQYTSGTTAMPKGVMLSHENMYRNASAVAARIGIRADDRYFSARPFYHVAGTTLSILAALSRGACLLTTPSFDAEESLRIMSEERCTLTSGNDTMFLMMMNHPRFAEYRLSLRGGWAAAGIEVMDQIRRRMGMREIVYCYGLSEASPNVVCSDRNDPWEERAAGLARPHEGMELRIVDEATSRALPSGEAGEIQVRGWSVMHGYYAKPEETRRALEPDGWLHTGDVGVLDAAGRLRFLGRAKDIFRVGGENVAPAEVEEVLHRHPAVKQAQVIGVPDPRLGEVAAAYVMLVEGAAATPEELVAWCRERCAGFKVPRYLRVVDSFEGIGMTGSAKVQKHRLREQALREFGLG